MILVEGKLKSWGRADLVIKILDDYLPDENVSLEDIVDAVRNCHDRQSALVYLQQECLICFATFPMNKVNLIHHSLSFFLFFGLFFFLIVQFQKKHLRTTSLSLAASYISESVVRPNKINMQLDRLHHP